MTSRTLSIFAVTMCAFCAATSAAGKQPASAPASQPAFEAFDDSGDLGGITPATHPSASKDGGFGGDDSPELMLFKDLPVVVAAGKRAQTQRQAAASVSIVSADDIELFGYRNLADVLRAQRSFYLHSDGLNTFAGVRGFLRPGEWNARLLVLVDGRPTNEVVYGQTHIDQDFVVPIEAMKRVEIIRGPGSSLYGSNAVFGVINVVTKDGADVNGVVGRVEGGSQGTARVNALMGTKFGNGWDVLADFSGFTTNGDNHIHYDGVHDAAHNFGNIDDADYQGAYSGFIKARKGDFTIEYDAENRLKDNRSATYLASFFDPGSMHEARQNLTMKLDHDFGDGQSLHGMVYYGKYHYQQDWLLAADGPTPASQYFTQASDDWIGEEVHYDWQATRQLHLLVGAEGTQSLYTRQDDHDSVAGRVFDTAASFNSFGVFGEADYKLSEQLTLVGGIRVDQTQRIGTTLSPRFGAIYTPTKEDAFKLLYGRAFRNPNLYELLYSDPGSSTPNPQLSPEIVDTYELVWERQFHNGWRTTLDGYMWEMADAMENVDLSDGSTQTQNVGTIWAHGIEAEVAKQWVDGTRIRAYGTYGQVERGGHLLEQSPKWILGTSIAVPVFKRETFLAIEPQIVGSMKSDTGQFVHPTYLTNVVFTSRDLIKGWTLQAGAYNIFANNARMPRDGAETHFQGTLNYPSTQYLISLSTKF